MSGNNAPAGTQHTHSNTKGDAGNSDNTNNNTGKSNRNHNDDAGEQDTANNDDMEHRSEVPPQVYKYQLISFISGSHCLIQENDSLLTDPL